MRILDDSTPARSACGADRRPAQRLQQLTSSDSQSAAALESARPFGGDRHPQRTIAARGPGLTMTIRDPDEEVRVSDVVDAIQELRERARRPCRSTTSGSASRRDHRQSRRAMVDGRPITAPYEFVVIGSPESMQTALKPRGSGAGSDPAGASVDIAPADQVVWTRCGPSTRLNTLRPTPSKDLPAPHRSHARGGPRREPFHPVTRRRSPHGHTDDRRYTDQHEWALVQGPDGTSTVVRVGIHRPRAGRPRRHRFVQLPAWATRSAPAPHRRVESTKFRCGRLRAVVRRRRSVNEALADAPETINSDPYGAGWLVDISVPGEGGRPHRCPCLDADATGAGDGAMTDPPPAMAAGRSL